MIIEVFDNRGTAKKKKLIDMREGEVGIISNNASTFYYAVVIKGKDGGVIRVWKGKIEIWEKYPPDAEVEIVEGEIKVTIR